MRHQGLFSLTLTKVSTDYHKVITLPLVYHRLGCSTQLQLQGTL